MVENGEVEEEEVGRVEEEAGQSVRELSDETKGEEIATGGSCGA